jgi:hypothetical protein
VSAITAIGQKGAAGLFGGLAGLLHGRPLHPAGIAFEARFTVPGPTAPELELFAQAGEHDAAVRFSRGLGLPEPLPEVLSVAFKVRDAYGPGADQDFLLTASGERPGLRHAFAWGRSHLAHSYSSVVPFSAAGRSVVFGARPLSAPIDGERDLRELARRAEEEALAFELRMASLRGPWQTLARIDVGRRLDEAEEQALRFNSDTTGGGIAATGFVNRLRGAAYDASTRVRPT